MSITLSFFQVFGENKFVFIAENDNPQKILDALNKSGMEKFNMNTTPIWFYENFAEEILGVDKSVAEVRLGMFDKPQTMIYSRVDIGHPGE